MSEDQKEKEIQEVTPEIQPETQNSDSVNIDNSDKRNSRNFVKNDLRSRKGKRGGPNKKPERVKSEYDQKTLAVRRVARVATGGRRFNFSVTIVIGNRKGSVGIGLGKAGDTALAIEKAVRDARRNLIIISKTETSSIPHEVEAKYGSSRIKIMPAPNKGLVAGGAVRDVLEYAGIKDVTGKILSGTKNPLNNARATVKALAMFKTRKNHAIK